MKLLALLSLSAAFSLCSLHAADSAYANSSLYLTSTESQEYSTANATSSAGYAIATASPGDLINAFSTGVSAAGSSTSYENESVTSFTDKLDITEPGMSGSAGTLDFNFTVSGSGVFSASAPAYSSLTAIANFVYTGGTSTYTYSEDSSGGSSGTDFFNTLETVQVPFTFGTPFTISLSIDFQGYVADGGTASVSGSFTTLAGTGNVEAAVVAQPLTNYSAKSASGVNYFSNIASPNVAAIPEPTNLALLGLAGCAVPPFLRRKRNA